jgi:hypothetical protein
MRHFLTIAALLHVSSAALAQGGSRAGAALSGGDRNPVVTVAGLQPFGRIVRIANDCAPDHPQAVWGAGDSPAGYACTDAVNGR